MTKLRPAAEVAKSLPNYTLADQREGVWSIVYQNDLTAIIEADRKATIEAAKEAIGENFLRRRVMSMSEISIYAALDSLLDEPKEDA